jgi:hypothetical protein
MQCGYSSVASPTEADRTIEWQARTVATCKYLAIESCFKDTFHVQLVHSFTAKHYEEGKKPNHKGTWLFVLKSKREVLSHHKVPLFKLV